MSRQQDNGDNEGASTMETTMADKGDNNNVTKTMPAVEGDKGD